MKMKMQPLSRRKLTKMVLNYEERFENLFEMLHEQRMHQPDFSGGLILNVFEENVQKPFYMVTDFYINEPYLNFYHLVPANSTEIFGIESFPKKEGKQKTGKYIKNLEKDKRWNRIYEQLFMGSVTRMQFVGRFTYTKHMDLDDNPATIDLPESDVIPFKKNKGKKPPKQRSQEYYDDPDIDID